MKIGYARISTRDQSLQLQIEALEAAGCEKIYQETASGAKTARPILDDLMNNIREGDTLVICKLDRLGRNLAHLLQLIDQLKTKKAFVISLNDPIDTTTPHGMMMFHLFGMVAEYERAMIMERISAGIKAARLRGINGGRKKGLSENAKEKAKLAQILYKSNNIPVSAITKQLGISRPTLYTYLRYRGVKIGVSPIKPLEEDASSQVAV
jgi:DNA invertase Pin-like site-specific DNA recombinase